MNALDIWGPALVASIVGVAAAAAFTWYFSFRADQDRKRGVRALLSQELMHNDAALRTLIGGLTEVINHAGNLEAANTFRATIARTPHWQHSRWDLPDVGNSFESAELTRLSEWYFGLDSVTFLYEGLIGQIESMKLDRGNYEISVRIAQDAAVRQMIAQLTDYAQKVLDNKPQVPDKRLDSDQHMQQYFRDLQARSSPTSPDTPIPGKKSG